MFFCLPRQDCTADHYRSDRKILIKENDIGVAALTQASFFLQSHDAGRHLGHHADSGKKRDSGAYYAGADQNIRHGNASGERASICQLRHTVLDDIRDITVRIPELICTFRPSAYTPSAEAPAAGDSRLQ